MASGGDPVVRFAAFIAIFPFLDNMLHPFRAFGGYERGKADISGPSARSPGDLRGADFTEEQGHCELRRPL